MKSPINNKKDKGKEKEKDVRYKINLYQNETNYSTRLIIVEGKLEILIRASKSFSEDIYEYSNTYNFKQLQITNKYFSNFKDIEEICTDLDRLLQLKVTVEEENNKAIILKIPTSIDKSSGEIIFKIMKKKKVTKIKNATENLKGKYNFNMNALDNKLRANNENNNTDNLLLGNITELVNRVKKLEKKESEKEKTINKLQEDITNYQEKLNNSYNYPIVNKLAKTDINLADDKNNQISQIIKNRNENEEEDDDDIDMDLDTEKRDSIKKKKNKKKPKEEIINTDINNKSKNKKKDNSDSDSDESSSESKKKKKKKRKKSDSSDEISEKEIKNIPNGKNDLDNDNTKLRNRKDYIKEKPKQIYESLPSGFPIVEREDIKDYINSRIFYTINEMQMVKKAIAKIKLAEKSSSNKNNSNKNIIIHAYFDLLYRASVDGDYEETINSLCGGSYPQLVLFLTHEGARFGVYIEKEKVTSFFKKEVSYKEIPGKSFLFSLNSLKIYNIQEGETSTDNRTEKLCFGRTYYYNQNESNWLIYIPRNEFLGRDLIFGDKESYYEGVKMNEIIGNSSTYHLKDVEIFKVEIEEEEGEINNKKNKKINILDEKEKINEEDEEKKNKIYNDETVINDKKNDDNEQNENDEDIKIVEKNKNKENIRKKIEINNEENDEDSD